MSNGSTLRNCVNRDIFSLAGKRRSYLKLPSGGSIRCDVEQRPGARQSQAGLCGGQGRNRTDIRGFAVPYITTLPPGHIFQRLVSDRLLLIGEPFFEPSGACLAHLDRALALNLMV